MQKRSITGRIFPLLFAASLFLAIVTGGCEFLSGKAPGCLAQGTGKPVSTVDAGESGRKPARSLWFLLLLLILAADLFAVWHRRRKRSYDDHANPGTQKLESAAAVQRTGTDTGMASKLLDTYRPLLEAIPDSVVLMTPEQEIFWINSAAGTNLGMEPAELIGRHCHEVWHHRIGDGIGCPGRKCLSTGVMETSRGWSRDQREFDIRAVPIIDHKGTIVCIIEMGRELSELQRIETQLRQSQKMELVGQLAGGIAHDFNNLLTAIMGFGYILQMKIPDQSPEKAHLSHIISAAERAAVLTESLLSFSRKHAPVMARMDLNQIVSGMESIMTRLLGEDIDLRISLSRTALPVLADRVLLGQVLLNLATNARDAMPNGGTLEIRTAACGEGQRGADAERVGSEGAALLEVRDSGVGMDADTVARVFEPFFTTKEDGRGTGLGLTIARSIVGQHGGRMEIASNPGMGTVFRTFLPMDWGDVAEPAQPVKPLPASGSATVLLVEDDSHTREFVGELLRGNGYRVVEAIDGGEGVERFLELRDEISLLICDLVGPGKNGCQVYQEILLTRPELKALYITGYPPDSLLRKGIRTGDVPLLFKPFDPLEFLARVRSLLC